MKKNIEIVDNDADKIPKELLKKIKRIEIRSKILVTDAVSGGYNSVFRGYGMEFEEVREYTPGDDVRRIDWNVTARHNKPFVKRFKEERQMNVMLLVDMSGSLQFGSADDTKSGKVAEVAGLVALTALSNQDKIGAALFTNEVEKYIPPSKNKNSILRLIREILFLKPKNKLTDINNALDFAIETMTRRGVIFILSDFFGDIDFKKVFIAKKKHDIIPVVIEDDFEETAINAGLVDMVDNETGELILVDTGSDYYKKSIEKRKRLKNDFLEELKKLNIEPLFINTKEEIERPIVQYFEKRKRKIR